MIVVEQVLGNLQDTVWAGRTASATIDWLELDQWNAQKNRLRAKTQAGVELALALDRGFHLRDGDVLAWEPAEQRVIAACLRLSEVLVIRLDELIEHGDTVLMRTCIELGHALGNQHWPAIVKRDRVYVPLAVDKRVMLAVMQTHGLPWVTYEFCPGAEVIPYLAPHEARRLFGGTETTHTHQHAP